MTEKKVLKAEGVGELIGGVTALLGYMPAHSLVIAPFVGSRAHSALRIDLQTDPETRAQIVATAMGITCRVIGVTGFAAIVFTDGTEAEHQALASDLLLAAEYIGLNVIEMAYVTPTGWGEFFEGAESPLDTLPALPGPDLIKDGDQSTGASLPVVDESLRMKILAAPLPDVETVDFTGLFEEVLTWDPQALDAPKAALLAGVVSLPMFRDAALIQWATDEEDGREALAAQRAFTHGGSIPDRIGNVLMGKAPRPQADRLQAALTVCRVLAAHTPAPDRAALLTVCTWLSWAMGNSTHASFYVDLAQKADPSLSMAHLLAEVLNVGMLPDWAFTA